ncbi:GNAT family N-acetyltransferase [Streptomyces sp. NPDC002490]|uniref:GNAT family N-acetyltransferase n=1 Tax=Streptomyces sp. NPDC002490 TaxID=3154416 RepID=UPI00332878CB
MGVQRTDLDVRPLGDGELPDWIRAMRTGFLRTPTPTPREVEIRSGAPGRLYGAFDAGRCVATYRSFDQRVTAVGGAPVAANAVSNVTVSPTHRRRGLLTRMIDADLRAARDRGDLVATLIAAEYRIYGRYGFGPAAGATEWEIDVARTGLDPRRPVPEEPGARLDLVDPDGVRALGPALHARVHRGQPGAVDRDARWWQRATGLYATEDEPWKEPFCVVHRSADGTVDGLLVYRTDEKWGEGKRPLNTATVEELSAATPAAERALWRYLCAVDWIATVRTGPRAPDSLVADLFPDARAARVTTAADWLWVRLLDVPGALTARSYEAAGSVVIAVVDEPLGAGGPSGGRFRLDAGPQGSSCPPTTGSAELVLPLGALARLWLGDASVRRLVDLGLVGEERPGAAARADVLFRTGRRPWCPDLF